MCNLDIRSEIKASGVFHWQVAEALGVSEVTFCRMLRRELPENRKNEIRAAVMKWQSQESTPKDRYWQ